MKINEDRKACQNELNECNLQNNLFQQRIDNSEEKVANLIAAEQKYKDNQIAYQTSLNASDTRIKELEKKNKGLKLKLRAVIVAVCGVLVKVLLF